MSRTKRNAAAIALGYWAFAALVFIWDTVFGSPNSFGFPFIFVTLPWSLPIGFLQELVPEAVLRRLGHSTLSTFIMSPLIAGGLNAAMIYRFARRTKTATGSSFWRVSWKQALGISLVGLAWPLGSVSMMYILSEPGERFWTWSSDYRMVIPAMWVGGWLTGWLLLKLWERSNANVVRVFLLLFALAAMLISGWVVYGTLAYTPFNPFRRAVALPYPAWEVLRIVLAALSVFVSAAATMLTGNEIGMALAPEPR